MVRNKKEKISTQRFVETWVRCNTIVGVARSLKMPVDDVKVRFHSTNSRLQKAGFEKLKHKSDQPKNTGSRLTAFETLAQKGILKKVSTKTKGSSANAKGSPKNISA